MLCAVNVHVEAVTGGGGSEGCDGLQTGGDGRRLGCRREVTSGNGTTGTGGDGTARAVNT